MLVIPGTLTDWVSSHEINVRKHLGRSGSCKHRWKWSLLLLILALQASALTAQDTNTQAPPPPPAVQPPDESNPLDPGRFVRNEYQMWTSPFRAKSWKSHTMKKYGYPFLAAAAGLFASDRDTIEILPNSPDQIKWSGRGSQLGASYTLAGFSGATYLMGKAFGKEHTSRTGLMGLEALAHAEVVVWGLKLATGRERPTENDGKGRFWKGSDSFPSGHSATTFAVATVFAYQYSNHIAVPIAAYSVATVIAASRTAARRHWETDVAIGSAIGFLIRRYVHKSHLPGAPPPKFSRLIPDVGFGGRVATLNWSF